jgi:hypothetical protein
MLNEIENGIVSLLTTKLDSARKVAVQKGVEGLVQPGVYANVEAGDFEKQGQRSYYQHLTVYVDIVFTSLKDQKTRREGINLILEGTLQLLLLKNLGLQIQPLRPKGWRNTTTPELDEKGLISYTLELTTAYSIIPLDDEVVTDLMTIGLDYYLQPDDTTVDSGDTISLPLLPKS